MVADPLCSKQVESGIRSRSYTSVETRDCQLRHYDVEGGLNPVPMVGGW